jgi:hypothetical protein
MQLELLTVDTCGSDNQNVHKRTKNEENRLTNTNWSRYSQNFLQYMLIMKVITTNFSALSAVHTAHFAECRRFIYSSPECHYVECRGAVYTGDFVSRNGCSD